MSTPAFGYLRVSGKAQIDGDGFPRQRAAIEKLAEAKGYQIVRWFEERGVSGKTEWDDRPAWAEMIVELGTIETIIIERLERLARDLFIQEHILRDLKKRHIVLLTAAEEETGDDDPTRVLFRQLVGAIAQYDRTMIVRKTAAARRRIREATGRCEGRKPYGQHPGFPEEKAVIERVRQMRTEKMGWNLIANKLNADGVSTRVAGRKWHAMSVRRIGL